MPTIIWSKGRGKDKLDPSMKKKAYAFFEKLQEDDALPGLNIEGSRAAGTSGCAPGGSTTTSAPFCSS